MNLELKDSWFYTTAIKDDEDLQNTFISMDKCAIKNESQILIGNAGIGKTTQAILACRDYCKSRYEEADGYWHYSFEPDFISEFEFSQLISDREFGNDEQKSKSYYRLEEIKNTPFLIFDDIKIKKASDYHKQKLENAYLEFFGSRYANRKSKITIITTNNTAEEFESFYSEAVCSRIFGLCKKIITNGHDMRKDDKTN